MKTDRELLELAAKAAGYEINFDEPVGEGDSLWFPHGYDNTGDVDRWWNPLTDDGDALRLAVKLRMDVEPWVHGDSACSRVLCKEVLIDEPHYGDDPEQATRRAIVRAAAAIGEAMP